MKSCGIIVEYNPFHNGHRYHAQQARLQTKADVIIAIMSGNFLQRGEPAIIDKWVRTEEALKNGVDLVIELPFAYAVQAADYFARGGIRLLQAMNCDALCFGTDIESDFSYEAFGIFVNEHQEILNDAYQKIKNNGVSYPQQMTRLFKQFYPEFAVDFSAPNHILGMSYAKENAKYERPMQLYPLKRKQAGYHDVLLYSSFASATAIRKTVFSNQLEQLASVVPKEVLTDLIRYPKISWENYWPLLKYKVVSSSTDEIRAIYQVNEGIENRLKGAIQSADSFQSFLTKIKTKRYTWTRLQRLLTYILVNAKKEEIEAVWQAPYLSVLGFNKKGQYFLKENKKNIALPIISKLGKENAAITSLNRKTDQLYQLGDATIKNQGVGHAPIQYK